VDESDDIIRGGAATTAAETTTNVTPGIDDIYTKIIDRVRRVDSVVNDYASKYGILKLEKEHDAEPNIGIPSPPLGLPPPVTATLAVLSKIKVPFRTLIFTIYLILDIARLAIGISGPAIGRKIMSILLAILELLRGDWKKALLTIIGYYGMIPMIMGQLMKAFLTLFSMLSPDIQNNIVFGSLDVGKSFIIGLLLSIFQVTAPAAVRQPLIDILKKIADKKQEMDGTLEGIGLSKRPEYLSPNWNDLNNIQAVLSDKAYICSCEGRQLVAAVNKSAIIRIILEILRIPINENMITQKCGKEDCKDFITTLVKEGAEEVPAVIPSVVPSVVPSVAQPTTPSLKPKSKGLLRRGLNELGGIAQNSLLQTVQGGMRREAQRTVRRAPPKIKANHRPCFW
jgi:hypothetical protein